MLKKLAKIQDRLLSTLNLSWLRRGDYKYHFIHIPKNGGNSLRNALKKRGDVSFSRPFHYRYIDVVDKLGTELKYFCVVRNPWSRTASRFIFGKQNAAKWGNTDPRKQYILNATFEDFVRDQKIFDIPKHPGQPWMGPLSSWLNQLEWIYDKDRNVACDCLRLEKIDEDLANYFGEIIKVPRENVSKIRQDYRDMYNDETRKIVAELFRDDIEYFGFTFDGTATRNFYGG